MNRYNGWEDDYFLCVGKIGHDHRQRERERIIITTAREEGSSSSSLLKNETIVCQIP